MLNTGKQFTRLKVVQQVDKPSRKERYYLCKCSCGGSIITSESCLTSGSTKSCGCLRSEKAREQIKINRQIMIENGNTTAPKTTTKLIPFNGEEKTCSAWANELGISRQALWERLKNHTIEEALADIIIIRKEKEDKNATI